MAPITPMDIFRLLDRSNCRKCGMPTCMSFSLAVAGGEKKPSDCHLLTPEQISEIEERTGKRTAEEGFQASLNALRDEFGKLHLDSIAPGLGGRYKDGTLTLSCLGKDFSIDSKGHMRSQCHVNTWMETLLMSYCIKGGPGILSGKWVPFSALRDCLTVAPYFARRCEEPLEAMADSHPDIFMDLLKVFEGKAVEGFPDDHAFMLVPLPRVPILILFNLPSEDSHAKLRIFFDDTAADHLAPEILTSMGRGIVEMFQRIISKHEEVLPELLSK